MSDIREMLKHLLTADYLGVEHKSSVLLSILRDPNLVRQAIRELRPKLGMTETTNELLAIVEKIDNQWRRGHLTDFAPVEVQIAGGRSALEVALELQDRLLNLVEELTGRREILRETNLVSYVQLMKLRIAQLNSLVVVDHYGGPVGQASYDAMMIELHRLRNT